MGDDSDLDQRSRRFGRVVPFRVHLPERAAMDRAAREGAAARAAFVVEAGRVVKPGFEPPEIVADVLCTRHVQEVARVVEAVGEPQVYWEARFTPIYDLVEDDRQGYMLAGGADVEEGKTTLALYLDALGIEYDTVAARPLVLGDAAMREIFYDDQMARKSRGMGGRTHLQISTSLPDLDLDRFENRLRDEGIDDEPWRACQLKPPPLVSARKAAPLIHVRLESFTIRSSYLDPGTWIYARWYLERLERVLAQVPPVRHRRHATLFDGYGPMRGPGVAPGAEASKR